jgi:hypothetical protein
VCHRVSGDGVEEDDVDEGLYGVGSDVLLVISVERASVEAIEVMKRKAIQHATTKERSGRHRSVSTKNKQQRQREEEDRIRCTNEHNVMNRVSNAAHDHVKM